MWILILLLICSPVYAANLTTGKIQKATAYNVIGDSVISEASGNIGINQSIPKAKLDVDGMVYSNGVRFNLSGAGTVNYEGLLQWNATDGTLDLGMSGGNISQQLGQEMFTKVVNKTGAPLSNGKLVYACGRQGNRPKACLAKADALATSRVMGMTTQDIADNAEGYVTTVGYVRQIKTDYTGWDEGDILYLSKTTAGEATVDVPSAPHYSDVVGSVGIIGGLGIGSILITFTDRHQSLEELSDVNGTPLATTGQFPVWNQSTQYFDFDRTIYEAIPAISGWTKTDLITRTTSDSVIQLDKSIYFGEPNTDGTWAIRRSGNNLVTERRESGVYVQKQSIVP